jgi:GTP-binding protein
LHELLSQLAILVDEARKQESPPVSFVLHRPESNEIRVERIADHRFEVFGGGALRAVAVNDLTNPDALAYVREKLIKLGVNRALNRAGARDQDIIVIGDFEFEYEAD